ncbi:MAG: STAS domain-containing protein [Thermodesulfobacteriota bacterium]
METQYRDAITIISTDERLDAVVAPRLKDAVKQSVDQARTKLVIDLGKTTFIDSSGCGALVASLRALVKNQGDMKIARPSPQAKALFELTRLHRVFEMFDDIEEAVNAFK